MIRVTGVLVRANDDSSQDILKGVDLALPDGALTFVLGPNGAGKSTLLKCLSGTLKPNAGEILLDGQPLAEFDLDELARHRAVLSQSNDVRFPFTAFEIAMMGRNPYIDSYPTARDTAIVNEVLEKVDAYGLRHRIFSTLSGGEQQRVHLARVLAQVWKTERAYLLLDEPTTALDLRHQHRILRLLKSLATERQWMIIAVLHDLHLAKMYGDHIVFMRDGEMFESTSESAFHPANVSAVFGVSDELAEWYGNR